MIIDLTSESLSTAVAAIMMFLMNIAGSQLIAGLTPSQKSALQSPYVRWIVIVAVFYVGTRDVIMTGLLSLSTILVLEVLLNESSRYYLFRRQNADGKIRSLGTGALTAWNK